MATYYVDSNATGLNDGSSWTDAWTSLQSSDGTATTGGDKVLVASDHAETYGSTTVVAQYATSGVQSPVQVISVDKTTGAYTRGASITINASTGAADVYLSGNARFCGLDVYATKNIYLGREGVSSFYDCTFTRGTNQNGRLILGYNNSEAAVSFESCEFDVSNDGGNTMLTVSRDLQSVVFRACSFVTNASKLAVFSANPFIACPFYFVDCDLTQLPAFPNAGSSTKNTINAFFERCNIPASWSVSPLMDAPIDILLVDCDSGTLTAPTNQIRQAATFGHVDKVLTHYRTDGANDGQADYSLKMTTRAEAQENSACIRSLPFTKTVAAGATTITVYVASGATLNDDDFWIEVSSPSEEVSATAQGKFRTTQALPNATPTALTSDSSTWTGSGTGTAQKVDVSINPTIGGTVQVRACFATPSGTVYVDPKISTSGEQVALGSVVVDSEPSGGGGGGATIHPLYAN